MPRGHRSKELSGQRFGRLVVERRSHSAKSQSGTTRVYWAARCDCGNGAVVEGRDLRSGHTASCGCLQKDVTRVASIRHEKSRSREYSIWSNMKSRCLNVAATSYPRYGAVGVTVCDRWRDSFAAFYEDMGPCPAGMTLERRNNAIGYEASNCRWATRREQGANTKRNRRVVLGDETLIVSEAARRLGFAPSRAHTMIARGQSPQEAIDYLKGVDHGRHH